MLENNIHKNFTALIEYLDTHDTDNQKEKFYDEVYDLDFEVFFDINVLDDVASYYYKEIGDFISDTLGSYSYLYDHIVDSTYNKDKTRDDKAYYGQLKNRFIRAIGEKSYHKAISYYIESTQLLRKQDEEKIKNKIKDSDLLAAYLKCNELTKNFITLNELKKELFSYSKLSLDNILTDKQFKNLAHIMSDEIYHRVQEPAEYLTDNLKINREFKKYLNMREEDVNNFIENNPVGISLSPEELWDLLEDNLL